MTADASLRWRMRSSHRKRRGVRQMLESISSSFVPLRPFIKFHKPIQVRHSQLGALPAGPNVAEDCAGPPNFIIDIYRAAREQFNYMYYTETRSIYLFDVSYKFGTISPVVNGSTHNIQRTSIWQYTRAGTHSVLIYIYRLKCPFLSSAHASHAVHFRIGTSVCVVYLRNYSPSCQIQGKGQKLIIATKDGPP